MKQAARPRGRILVLDHDSATRRLLAAALASYDIVTVKSETEARDAVNANPDFQLILSDLAKTDFLTHMRSIDSEVPILVLSSLAKDRSIAEAFESGADDYLQKPVDLTELRRTVAHLVDQFWSRRAADERENGGTRSSGRWRRPTSNVRTDGEGTFVELTATTDPIQAERFQRFAERLVYTSLGEKERADLRLALEEVVRNAIEWGNQNDVEKKLRLSYCLLPDRITFRIEDEGGGFDPGGLIDPSADPAKHIKNRRESGKRMGGWGIFMVRKLMDEVTFNAKGNIVYLTKHLKKNSTI